MHFVPSLSLMLCASFNPWSVNTIAQAVGEAALLDEPYVRRSQEFVREQRERVYHELTAVPGLTVYPGSANFLFVRMDCRTWMRVFWQIACCEPG